MDKFRRRFGAILWEASANMDDAIRMVEAFADPDSAISRLTTVCSPGQKWAVVEIPGMRIVASSGPASLSSR
ncbi:MAG: hypothetical protein JO337_09975 [Acidimicrobiales bacterium]|nr:hypothetical protein [Acidimicrobiales bacterium]